MTWGDGTAATFHHFWLRDNCGCRQCRHPDTLERILDPLTVPADLDATSVSITDAGGLRVEWFPEGHVSDYDPDWLRAHCHGENDGSHCGPVPVTWGAELSKSMPGADYDAVTGSDNALLRWLRFLRDSGVAVLRGTPREPLSVLALAGLIGPARATNFGEHFDVVSKPEPNSNAYTALGLLCHTDLPNWERPPDYQLLHCLENDADGGDSILVDGFHAAETLRLREPAAFRLLSQSPIDFRFRDRESDIRFRAPTIGLDEVGAVTEVRFNFAVMDAIDAPAGQMGALCRALRCLRSSDSQSGIGMSLSPAAGRAIGVRQSPGAARARRVRSLDRPAAPAGLLCGPGPVAKSYSRPGAICAVAIREKSIS